MVLNKAHGVAEEISDTIYDVPKEAPYLYIEADEDYVAEQHGSHTDELLNKSFISKLIYLYEYKQDSPEGSGKKEIVNRYYFNGLYPGEEGNRKPWMKVNNFIEYNYVYEKLKKILISGDGAAWIKTRANYLDKAVFCADKYHLMKYVNAAAT